jgi:hypothetical protein
MPVSAKLRIDFNAIAAMWRPLSAGMGFANSSPQIEKAHRPDG